MPRVPTPVARVLQHVVDIGTLGVAYLAAFLVRFEFAIPAPLRSTLVVTLPIVITLQLVLLRSYDVHLVAWRYVSLRDARRILQAIAIATLVLLFIRMIL